MYPFEGTVAKNSKERQEVKSKGEKERYTHLNAECQRIAREIRMPSLVISAKKQRKTVEWERLEILFKKIRDTKGTFHAKMGTIKDRKGMDLTEAEDIKERWQEEGVQKNCTKKIFMTQISTMV